MEDTTFRLSGAFFSFLRTSLRAWKQYPPSQPEDVSRCAYMDDLNTADDKLTLLLILLLLLVIVLVVVLAVAVF
jgi:hypothetical protein